MEIFSTPEFWVAVSFVLFIGLLAYYQVFGKVTKALDARAEQIRRELDEARALRDEAQKILEEYEQKRKGAEQEAAEIVAHAKREADALSKEMRQTMKEQLERRTELAKDKIARAEAQAVSDVRGAAIEAALGAAERLIAKKLTQEAQSALIEKTIEDAKAKLN